MAISVIGVSNAAGQVAGNSASNTAAITPTMPAGAAAGDRIYVFQSTTTTVAAAPAGWTDLVTDLVAGIDAAAGEETGRRRISIRYRDYDGVWTMPSFASSGSFANMAQWLGAVAIRPSAGATFDTPTASTVVSQTATTSSHWILTTGALTTHSGGLAFITRASGTNGTAGATSLSQSGATFGTATERCDGGTSLGFNASGSVHSVPVTVGGTGGLTVDMLVTNSRGGVMVAEQTETASAPDNTGAFFAMF